MLLLFLLFGVCVEDRKTLLFFSFIRCAKFNAKYSWNTWRKVNFGIWTPSKVFGWTEINCLWSLTICSKRKNIWNIWVRTDDYCIVFTPYIHTNGSTNELSLFWQNIFCIGSDRVKVNFNFVLRKKREKHDFFFKMTFTSWTVCLKFWKNMTSALL